MYVNTKLTLMALFLLQFAYLTQTRHIVSRSTDNDHEDCTAKNVTKNAAACFLSHDLTKRLKGLKESVGLELSRESDRVADLEGGDSFYGWQNAWKPCNSSKWAISYLHAEAVKGTTQFNMDYLNVLGRTSNGTENMNDLINPVESLLSELKCEIKSMLENCPLLYGYPESNITMQADVEQDQPWRGDISTDFIAAKFWVVWYNKMHCIYESAKPLDARQNTNTGRQDCSHSICVE